MTTVGRWTRALATAWPRIAAALRGRDPLHEVDDRTLVDLGMHRRELDPVAAEPWRRLAQLSHRL